jgi:hypothetical protein
MLDSLEDAVFKFPNLSVTSRIIKVETYGLVAEVLSPDDAQSFSRLIEVILREEEHMHIARSLARVGKYIPDTLIDRVLEASKRLEFDHDLHESSAETAIRGILHRLSEKQLDLLASTPGLDSAVVELLSNHVMDHAEAPNTNNDLSIGLPQDVGNFVETCEFPKHFWWDPRDPEHELVPEELLQLKAVAPSLSQEQLLGLGNRILQEDNIDFHSGNTAAIRVLAPHMSAETQIEILRRAYADTHMGHSVLVAIAEHLAPLAGNFASECIEQEPIYDRKQSIGLLASRLDAHHLTPFLNPEVSLTLDDLQALARLSGGMSEHFRSEVLDLVLQHLGIDERPTTQLTEIVRQMDWIQADSALLLLEKWLGTQHDSLYGVEESLPRVMGVILNSGNTDALIKAISIIGSALERAKRPSERAYLRVLSYSCIVQLAFESRSEELVSKTETLKEIIISDLVESAKDTHLRYLFAAISSCGGCLSKEYRMVVLEEFILKARLDESGTGDLSYLAEFLKQASPSAQWYDRLFDKFDQMVKLGQYNIPLVHAVLEATDGDNRITERVLSFADLVEFEQEAAFLILHVAAVIEDRVRRNEVAARALKIIQNRLGSPYRQEAESELRYDLTEYGAYLKWLDLDDSLLNPLVLDESIPCYLRAQLLAVLGTGQGRNPNRYTQLRSLVLKALSYAEEKKSPPPLTFVSRLSMSESLQVAEAFNDRIYSLVVELTESWAWQ